ncbi:hypothetical protein ACRJ4W_18825 [Streptomyces sp. GLT-R25]
MDNGSQARETRLVELVVPGIGPVDRAEALEPPVVHRISGDEAAGWYGTVAEDDTEPLVERQVYDWNRLTIGGAGRAMWLLLLPFLLINLVTWMQPRLPRHSRVSGWLYDFGARLLGLSLTVMLVGVFGQAAMDQVVWQCGAPAHSACGAENPLVEAARDVGTGIGLTLAAVVPLLVGAVMAFSARDAKKEYRPVLKTVEGEEYRRLDREDKRQARGTGKVRRPLEVRGFWEYNWRAEGLTSQHRCAGLLTVAMLVIVPGLQYDLRRDRHGRRSGAVRADSGAGGADGRRRALVQKRAVVEALAAQSPADHPRRVSRGDGLRHALLRAPRAGLAGGAREFTDAAGNGRGGQRRRDRPGRRRAADDRRLSGDVPQGPRPCGKDVPVRAVGARGRGDGLFHRVALHGGFLPVGTGVAHPGRRPVRHRTPQGGAGDRRGLPAGGGAGRARGRGQRPVETVEAQACGPGTSGGGEGGQETPQRDQLGAERGRGRPELVRPGPRRAGLPHRGPGPHPVSGELGGRRFPDDERPPDHERHGQAAHHPRRPRPDRPRGGRGTRRTGRRAPSRDAQEHGHRLGLRRVLAARRAPFRPGGLDRTDRSRTRPTASSICWTPTAVRGYCCTHSPWGR